jgi:hypothetical protein
MKGSLAALLVLLLLLTPTTASALGPAAPSLAEARTAIEDLPWTFEITHPPKNGRNALVIRTTDAQERTFRFFLFRLVHRRTPLEIGIPSFHPRRLAFRELTPDFLIFANESAQIRPEHLYPPFEPYDGGSDITEAMEDEYFEIEFAVEDAVCELATGKRCPAF